jgi:hypothetical protein
MTRRRLLLLPLVGLPVLAGLALAQERPRIEPSRDVAVTYRLIGAFAGPQPGAAPNTGAAPQLRLAFRAAGRLVRFDEPDGTWVVADLAGGRAFAVSDPARQITPLPPAPSGDGPPGLIPPGGRFTRTGTERIAGIECTAYRVDVPGAGSGQVCLTADGVVLKSLGRAAANEPEQGVVALEVSYAAQDATRFQPPTGYRTVALPPSPPGR